MCAPGVLWRERNRRVNLCSWEVNKSGVSSEGRGGMIRRTPKSAVQIPVSCAVNDPGITFGY